MRNSTKNESETPELLRGERCLAPDSEKIMLLGFLSCKEAITRLDDYIDRELSPREMRRVARHLKICAHCARQFRFEAEIIDGLRAKIERIEAPPELLQKIRTSLRQSPEAENRP